MLLVRPSERDAPGTR